MISLPIVLANFGIIGSLLLMILFCWVTYVSAMIRCELNINSQSDFSLKDVGLFFGGRISASLGDISLKILSFALLSAYIFGGASIIRSFLWEEYQFIHVAIVFTIIILLMFIFLSDLVIKINKHAFITLFSIIMIGIVCLTMSSKTESFPINMEGIFQLKSWSTVLPVIFTSFGFQGSLHSLTKFVDNDRKLIKRACIFGSIIPVVVYVLWVSCVLTIIFNSDPESFNRMLREPIEVSELIHILSSITKINFIQHAAWIVSFLAIFTSIIGVGLSLNEILKKDLEKIISSDKICHITSTILMIIPSSIVAILVPNAFIRVLNFAGIILAIIAIILPVFLFTKMQKSISVIYNFKTFVIFIVGIVIIIFGILDILK
jgi:tyrosine-specific transport protein